MLIITLSMVTIALLWTTYAAVNVTTNINSSGSIAVSSNIGVYSDSTCAVPLTSINWGSPSPGGAITQTVYIKNTQGATPLTLSLSASNWSPTSANGPLTVTWNQQGTVLAPGNSVAAIITLSVSSSVSGISTFSVQISISGSG